jgi:hypothetical protein
MAGDTIVVQTLSHYPGGEAKQDLYVQTTGTAAGEEVQSVQRCTSSPRMRTLCRPLQCNRINVQAGEREGKSPSVAYTVIAHQNKQRQWSLNMLEMWPCVQTEDARSSSASIRSWRNSTS